MKPLETPIRFSPDAQKVFAEWNNELLNYLRTNDLIDAMDSHFMKYSAMVASLALLFHVIDPTSGWAVSLESTSRAVAWSKFLAAHANRTYGVGLNQNLAYAKLIQSRHDQLNTKFSARDIRDKEWAGIGKSILQKYPPGSTQT